MKKRTILKATLIPVTLAAFLTGCASYDAAPLNNPSPEAFHSSQSRNEEVQIVARAFDKNDCSTYLDRDVVRKGYQPVQLFIQNNSDKNFLFSLNRISLPCARPDEVADKVHTSTVGRVVGYGAGALIFWPLVIPAIVDGIKSSEANTALDSDFVAKTAKDQVIYAHSHVNTLIFVPVNSYQPSFNLSLLEEDSQEIKTLNITAVS
jgi:hypothetical protein